MKKVYLRVENNGTPLYWGGNGWWTRRRDRAQVFENPQEAQAEMAKVITVSVEDVEERFVAHMAES